MQPHSQLHQVRRLPRRLVWTACFRVLPGVVVAGGNRCGTSSTHDYLCQHPQLVPGIRKEIHFFDVEENYARGEALYRAHFPTRRRLRRLARADGLPRTAVDATPAYMFFPHVPARMRALLPRARIIVLLRDPVGRAYSNWKHHGKKGKQLGSFREEVEHELAVLGGRSGPLGDCAPRLLPRGHYADQLERVFAAYPREQVFVGFSEDLFRDAAAFCRRLFAFLGLDPAPVDCSRVKGRSGGTRNVDADLRAALDEHFAPHDERLEALLGARPPWRA